MQGRSQSQPAATAVRTRCAIKLSEAIVTLHSAGNTYNPALVILDEQDYSLRVEIGHDHNLWCAEKDGQHFSASNPLELLAVVSIFERFGDDWQDAIGNPNILDAVYDAAELPEDECE